MNDGTGGGSASCGGATSSGAGGGGSGLSGEVPLAGGRLEFRSGCCLLGERPGDPAGTGDMALDNDSGTSNPYRCRGGRGLAVRDPGSPVPNMPKLVLLE
jgi:hypothetical protein